MRRCHAIALPRVRRLTTSFDERADAVAASPPRARRTMLRCDEQRRATIAGSLVSPRRRRVVEEQLEARGCAKHGGEVEPRGVAAGLSSRQQSLAFDQWLRTRQCLQAARGSNSA
eukprot:6053427-Prymnesium_polylepis.2